MAQSTRLSRRSAEAAIKNGEVSVNGKVVRTLGVLADPFRDVIKWKGRVVRVSSEKIYLAYNKPKNVIVSKSDPQGRRTIWKSLDSFRSRLNAVGRLDFDSEGLLILTNDGELINRLTHPRHEVEKIYKVKVKGVPTRRSLDQLKEGIVFRGEQYQPAKLKKLKSSANNTWFEIKISEGKNRQVRNMFEAINHPVLKLQRIAVGAVKLGGLEPGKWRELTKREVGGLFINSE